MNLEELRNQAHTLAQRAVGGASVDKLADARNALYAGIIDALITVSPRREIADPYELRAQLDALTGAGAHYTRRQLVVQHALAEIVALLDRIDPTKKSPHTRPDFTRVWHER
jgi:hypothetical protein